MTNSLAIKFIKAREKCVLKAYKDSGGVWTCGWGITGPDIHEGTEWTQEYADLRFMQKYEPCEQAIEKAMGGRGNQYQQAAFISDGFNLGVHGTLTSTFFQTFIQGGDDIVVAKQMLNYDHVAGIENKGVLARRMLEAALFLSHTTWES